MTNSVEYGIVGAGPAGSHLASRLAQAGLEVALFDPKGAWEKPCGGGLTSRALKEFPFLLNSTGSPRQAIDRITIVSPAGLQVTVALKEPFAVYSRLVLNGMILDRAIESGAAFIRAAVNDFERSGDGWTLSAGQEGETRARFLVGADGAASPTRRRLVGIFTAQDLALAFGYNVREEPGNGTSERASEVKIVFPRDFTGYLWAFPRPGVMNFGVACKLGERTSDELRRLLREFICEFYGGDVPDPERMSFFGAKIPTLDLASWPGLRATGEGWALIGDAAGFADPITGEGIYYALKSADLLADAIIEARMAAASDPYTRAASVYEQSWRKEFGKELQHASYRLPQFYHGYFFGHLITDAMVWLAKRHRGVRSVLVKALTGEQSYVNLKRDLVLRALQVF